MPKTCVKCKKTYFNSSSNFYKATAHLDGLSAQCKFCKNLYTKNHRLKQKGKPPVKVAELKPFIQNRTKKMPKKLLPPGYKQCTKCFKILINSQFYQTKKGLNPSCIACTKQKYKETTKVKLKNKKQAKKDLIIKFSTEVDFNAFVSPWEFSLASTPSSFEEDYKKVFPQTTRVPVTQAEHEHLTGTELTDIYLRRAILMYGYKVLVIAYSSYNPFEYIPYNFTDALKNARFKDKILSTMFKKEFFINHDKFRDPDYITKRFINYRR